MDQRILRIVTDIKDSMSTCLNNLGSFQANVFLRIDSVKDYSKTCLDDVQSHIENSINRVRGEFGPLQGQLKGHVDSLANTLTLRLNSFNEPLRSFGTRLDQASDTAVTKHNQNLDRVQRDLKQHIDSKATTTDRNVSTCAEEVREANTRLSTIETLINNGFDHVRAELPRLRTRLDAVEEALQSLEGTLDPGIRDISTRIRDHDTRSQNHDRAMHVE
jgi:exonuclease VII large subunit